MPTRPPSVPQENEPKRRNRHGRREFIATVLAGAAGLAVTGFPRSARADTGKERIAPGHNTDPAYNKLRPILRERYEYKEALLSPEEIKLMDESMRAIFRSFLQPSFFMYAVPVLKGDDVRKSMELAVENHGALEYTKDEDGFITIRKRETGNPSSAVPDDFRMEIKDGVLTEVNGNRINTRALEDWKKEWDEIKKKIPEINGSALLKKPFKTTQDLRLFEFYCLKLPRLLRDLARLKISAFGPNDDESQKITDLEAILKTHPQNLQEYFNGKLNFYVIHNAKSGCDIELIYPAGHTDAMQTIIGFSTVGFIQKDTGGNSSKSFEDLYKERAGIQ